MFTKRSLIVGIALVLAMIYTGLVAASAHTAEAPPTQQQPSTHAPFALVRHIELPDLALQFPSDDKLFIVGKLLPVLDKIPILYPVTKGTLLAKPMQNASNLLNGLFNLGAPNGEP